MGALVSRALVESACWLGRAVPPSDAHAGGRSKRDSEAVRQALTRAERELSERRARSSMRVSVSAPTLAAIGQASALNVLDDEQRLAVLHAMYALSQVTDGSGAMPEQLVPLFEKACCALIESDSATLYEYDEARAELHCEIHADGVPFDSDLNPSPNAGDERVSTVIELGVGEVGKVALRASQGEYNVCALWSPSPGTQAIAVPMRTHGGYGRLVGVVTAVRRAAPPQPVQQAAGGEAPTAATPPSASTAAPLPFGARDEAALRALADGAAALVLQMAQHRETMIMRYQAELLLALHAAEPKVGGLDEAILGMITILIKMLSAERVSLFIADDARQEFWVRTSETQKMGGTKGVVFKFGAGIVGRVYTTKKALNLPDAYRCAYFSPKFDRETGYVTRQVLAVPMLEPNTGRVIAVLQALNKHNGTDVFTTNDERILALCCEKIASTMVQKLGRATFRELLHDKRAHTQAFRIISGTEEAERQPFVPPGGDAGMGSPGVNMSKIFSSQPQHELTLAVSAWSLDKDQMTVRVMQMLAEMQVCSTLNIPEESLLRFLGRVQTHYLDTPYHNYQHAFTVTLICFHLLKDSRTHRDVLRPLDVLALLLSAICHDVGHPGVNNSFLVNSQADLALLYNDQSVLENHHAAMMFKLLRSMGEDAQGEHDILGKLNARDAADFRRTCIQTILGTDMTKHFSQVDTLHSIAAKLQTRREATEMRANVRASTSSISGACGGAGSGAGPPPLLQVLTGDDSDVVKALEEAKQQLLESVLHCADIGAPALPFEEARTWAIRVVDEFKQQTETELRTGLPTPPAMLQTLEADTECTAIGMQVQFISYFVQPIWGALEKVLPEIHGYNATIAANLAQFKELHAQLLKRKAAASAPAVAAEREVVSSSSVAATSTSDGPPASSGS